MDLEGHEIDRDMKQIWKFELEVKEIQVIDVPKDFKFLDIQEQNGKPVMWALVNTEIPVVPRTIKMYGTGWPVYYGEIVNECYLKTVQIGNLVCHYFNATYPNSNVQHTDTN